MSTAENRPFHGWKVDQRTQSRGATLTTVVLPKTIRMKPFANLLTEVIRTNICDGCGACIATCPVSVIDMKAEAGKDENPTLIGRCILCQYCYYSCPRIELPKADKEIKTKLFTGSPALNAKYAPQVGPYLAIYSARAKKPEIVARATDGGIVTSLLTYAKDTGIVTHVAGAGTNPNEPFRGIAKVATTHEDLLNMAGTTFNIAPVHVALREAVEEYDAHAVGLVGLPCQIQPTRKMQHIDYGYLKYGEEVKLTIGLFCAGAFYYDGLMKEHVEKEKGVDLKTVTKINIKKGHFLVYKNNDVILDTPLKEIKKHKRANCNSCPYGFSADEADISVGANGSPSGWTTVIVRTETGRKVFEGAVEAGLLDHVALEERSPGIEEILKLENIKKTRLERFRKAEEAAKAAKATAKIAGTAQTATPGQTRPPSPSPVPAAETKPPSAPPAPPKA